MFDLRAFRPCWYTYTSGRSNARTTPLKTPLNLHKKTEGV